ncbi:hypothetical protein GW791_03210, partial [Candidatus Saccharibacteria bacterium]|nr:hypothetical protein [Candidatus Saccharibacteria bacterium]
MAKKKKSSRKKKFDNSAPQHSLPLGFWNQVGALFLIAISILFVIAWFNAGGPVLEWMHATALSTIGYAIYVVPALFFYVAVEIFRAEKNRLPFVMKFATTSAILWFSALFGLLKKSNGATTGGYIGDFINKSMLALVDSSIAAFIYILLIGITLLFILRVSPFTIIKKIWEFSRRDTTEYEENVKVMRNAAAVDEQKSSIISHFKLHGDIPIEDSGEVDDKRQSKLSTLRSGFSRDKAAEEQAALVTINDPNWVGPSLDLLEKKQAPADPGDVQQNAAIIKNTLSEFDIDVTMEGANMGPRVTQYTLSPPSGVKLTRITALETNIALNLAAQSLRIEAPIPGQK